MNNLVLGVNELQVGCAISVVDDISRELEKLLETAKLLGFPNAYWTLIISSTSDSATTQKCGTNLIEDRREADEERFGPATIETFSAMPFVTNLRKAF